MKLKNTQNEYLNYFTAWYLECIQQQQKTGTKPKGNPDKQRIIQSGSQLTKLTIN